MLPAKPPWRRLIATCAPACPAPTMTTRRNPSPARGSSASSRPWLDGAGQRQLNAGLAAAARAVRALGDRMIGTGRRLESILGIVALSFLAIGCFLVLRPFASSIMWAVILTFSTWPVYARLEAALGGRRSLAALIMTLLLAAAFILPLVARRHQRGPRCAPGLRAGARACSPAAAAAAAMGRRHSLGRDRTCTTAGPRSRMNAGAWST